MRKGVCRHFKGTDADTCKAGVDERKITGGLDFGWAMRIPCIRTKRDGSEAVPKNGVRASCPQFEEPTEEEIAAYDREVAEMGKRLSIIGEICRRVKLEDKGEDWQGNGACPLCGKTLRLTHAAFNGHVWGQCETPGCLSWME